MHIGLRTERFLYFSRYEANQLGSEVIEPVHLLLGICRERIQFPPLDYESLSQIHKEVLSKVSEGKEPVKTDLVYSPTSRLIMCEAVKCAERWGTRGCTGSPYLESIHIIVALMKKNDFIRQVLRSRGVDMRVLHRKMRNGKDGEFYRS